MYSALKDKIWGADLADMQLISKFNKGFRFLLCIVDVFSKYARVVLLKNKKGLSIVNSCQVILKDSTELHRTKYGTKPNKIWEDKASEFYNNSFKKVATRQ